MFRRAFGLVTSGVGSVLSLPGTDFGHKVVDGGHPLQPVLLRTTRWSAVMPSRYREPLAKLERDSRLYVLRR